MQTGDVLQFTTKGYANQQEWQTTWFYRVRSITGGFEPNYFIETVSEWADWFFSTFWPVIDNAISNNVTAEEIKGFNLFQINEVAQYVAPVPATGAAGSTTDLPQWVAYGFTHGQGVRGMNSGKRRFAGVVESAVGSFGIVESAFQTALEGAATQMSSPLTLTLPANDTEIGIDPVIVKRVRSGSGTPTSPYKYRLPVSQGELVYYLATNWTADKYVTSQNSRKTGRGV